jgi:hypothetical protein
VAVVSMVTRLFSPLTPYIFNLILLHGTIEWLSRRCAADCYHSICEYSVAFLIVWHDVTCQYEVFSGRSSLKRSHVYSNGLAFRSHGGSSSSLVGSS